MENFVILNSIRKSFGSKRDTAIIKIIRWNGGRGTLKVKRGTMNVSGRNRLQLDVSGTPPDCSWNVSGWNANAKGTRSCQERYFYCQSSPLIKQKRLYQQFLFNIVSILCYSLADMNMDNQKIKLLSCKPMMNLLFNFKQRKNNYRYSITGLSFRFFFVIIIFFFVKL